MTEPLACGILITADRPVMTARAVRCFEQQSYPNKKLVIYDTSTKAITRYASHYQHCEIGGTQKTIGELRNAANAMAAGLYADAEIFMHFDSDDWSHPKRMEEQVAFLIESEADMVGYSNLLLWKEPVTTSETCHHLPACECGMCKDAEGKQHPVMVATHLSGEAYLYTRGSVFNVPGTSLCYWTRVWQNRKFLHLPQIGNPRSSSEDTTWQNENGKLAAMPSVLPREGWPLCWRWSADSRRRPQDAITQGGWAEKSPQGLVTVAWADSMPPAEPRMVASIHGANTRNYDVIHRAVEYKRVPEWDDYCRRMVQL